MSFLESHSGLDSLPRSLRRRVGSTTPAPGRSRVRAPHVRTRTDRGDSGRGQEKRLCLDQTRGPTRNAGSVSTRESWFLGQAEWLPIRRIKARKARGLAHVLTVVLQP